MLTRMMHAAKEASTSMVHTGSSAGLRAESSAVVQMAGSGYSGRSIPSGRSASLSLPRSASGGRSVNHGPVDMRSVQHPKLSLDRQLSRLL